MSIAKAFMKSNRLATVRELQNRVDQLGDALEWIDDSSEAAPIEEELRIIAATLRAILKEHAPGYFREVSHESAH